MKEQAPIVRLETEFAAAKPSRMRARVWVPRALLALMLAADAVDSYRRGNSTFVLLFIVVLLWMALEINESGKLARLHATASKIIAHYKREASA